MKTGMHEKAFARSLVTPTLSSGGTSVGKEPM